MKNTNKKWILQATLSATVGLGLAACTGGGGSDSSTSSLDVSGVISLEVEAQSFEKMQPLLKADDMISSSVDLTAYQVTCATTTAPIQSDTGAVGADGSFTVSIPSASGQPLSCYLVDADGEKAADFIIEDESKKDLNGNSETTSTAAFKSNANLGTINFNPNSGEVKVPKANIASVVSAVSASAAEMFDPTGDWTISAVDFTVPTGVKSPCAENDNTCHGPPSGQPIYLKMWKGLVTADSSDIYGLQVWDGTSTGGFASCGSKIGLTSDMKTSLGVDFSANGTADDVFSFATSVSGFDDQLIDGVGSATVNLTDGWKMDTAKLTHDVNPSCAPHDLTVGSVVYSNAWLCGPDNGGNYQAHLGGGCTDSSGNPVNPSSWTGITCGSVSTDSNGVKSNSCSGTVSVDGQSTAVTCTSKWVVTNGSYAVQPSGTFNWSDLSAANIPANTVCSSMDISTENKKIAQLQCYAEYYYRSGMERANACLPRVDLDWSSSTAANFAKVDKIRPQSLVFFEKYAPFPDGSGGSIMTRQEHYEGVQVGSDSWVNCRVIEVGGLSIKKVSDTKLLATYQSSTITTSITKPACLAKFNGTRESYLFYLNK